MIKKINNKEKRINRTNFPTRPTSPCIAVLYPDPFNCRCLPFPLSCAASSLWFPKVPSICCSCLLFIFQIKWNLIPLLQSRALFLHVKVTCCGGTTWIKWVHYSLSCGATLELIWGREILCVYFNMRGAHQADWNLFCTFLMETSSALLWLMRWTWSLVFFSLQQLNLLPKY